MFDKLIESEPAGAAEFHNRKSYFLVSSVLVGVLFITAVVISIYAADFGLGSSSFELAAMVAPLDTQPPPTEDTSVRRSPLTKAAESQLPARQVNMLRTDELPTSVPTSTSVIPNSQQARPRGEFMRGPFDSNSGEESTTGRQSGRAPGTAGVGLAQAREPSREKDVEAETGPPPPIIKKAPPIKSGGVMNGKATYLPKPLYSAAAKGVGAQGQVQVQVTIDESGMVTSASALNGNVLLRQSAEDAARKARFTPTTLTGVPVKVTGVIIYNFVR